MHLFFASATPDKKLCLSSCAEKYWQAVFSMEICFTKDINAEQVKKQMLQTLFET